MATLTTPPVETPETDLPLTAAGEPSMEDILASIRRIIAEDQTNGLGRTGFGGLGRMARHADGAAPPASVPSAANEAATGADDVLAPDPAPAHDVFEQAETPSDDFETHRPDEPALVEAPAAASLDSEPNRTLAHDVFVAAEPVTAGPEGHADEQPLMSPVAGAAITSSFHALAESMLLQDKAMVERLTRDELRPLLKSWLDDNLPSIVERLVRNEIERVARGGRARD